MIFRELELAGAWLLEVEAYQDTRGFFGRTFCREEFLAHGLQPLVEQCNLSRNTHRGTLRGMHFQTTPHAEVKLIRVVRGSILDVIVDLRPRSPTYMQHVAIPLNDEKLELLYVPENFAHGFQTLADTTEVTYQMSSAYQPGAARGFAWDDPNIGINWPFQDPILSPKDAEAPLFHPSLLAASL